MRRSGRVTTTRTIRIVDVKNGEVTISIEGQEIKIEGLDLEGFKGGPYYDSEYTLHKGDTLTLPHMFEVIGLDV
jgi:hypothetical protein